MSTTKDFIVEQLKQQIEGFKSSVKEQTVGRVIEVGDGIARVSGISEVMMSEMLEFTSTNNAQINANNPEFNKIYGVAMNLEEDSVGVIILGDSSIIKEGDEVRCLNRILEVPVGETIIGRVVNPLGEPIDGK